MSDFLNSRFVAFCASKGFVFQKEEPMVSDFATTMANGYITEPTGSESDLSRMHTLRRVMHLVELPLSAREDKYFGFYVARSRSHREKANLVLDFWTSEFDIDSDIVNALGQANLLKEDIATLTMAKEMFDYIRVS